MYHVMIDLETLGVHNTAPLTSVGMAVFDPRASTIEETQLAHLNVDDQAALYNRKPSAFTLAWWLRQSPEAQAKIANSLDSGIKFALHEQLEELAEYIKTWIGKEGYVWGYGANEDIAWLSSLFDVSGVARPWHYRKVLCYRTMLNVYAPTGLDWFEPTVAHDPVADAVAQALTLQRMVQKYNLTFTSKAVA